MQFCHQVKTRSSARLSPVKSSGVELWEQGEWCKKNQICTQLFWGQKKELQGTHTWHRQGCWRGRNYRNGKFAEKVCILLFMWLKGHEERKTLTRASNDVIQRFLKGICRRGDNVRAKTTLFYKGWNSQDQLELLHPGFYACVKNTFGIFSVFPRVFLQCDICGTHDHQSVTS